MRILLTGVTGYIGKRLLIQLLDEGHHIICAVRDVQHFNDKMEHKKGSLEVIYTDFLKPESLTSIPKDIDAAYYLIHSMSTTSGDFEKMEEESAINFKNCIEKTTAQQVIYLTGIVNNDKLSKHLTSRKKVEETLASDKYALTALRAGIIVGSGSASFEIIRDLVEKLPLMVTPIWIKTKCQPIAIRNVIQFLTKSLLNQYTYNKGFDIAGTDVLTYKEMLLKFAEVRKLKRRIITVPVMTPKLSSYWLYFVTSTSYPLAKNLVNSMKIDVIANKNNLAEVLNIKLIDYKHAIELAFDKIQQNDVLSSWYDSFNENFHEMNMWQYMEVPEYGCFRDVKKRKVINEQQTVDRIFSIGGKNGWYYADFLWSVRGLIDKLFGGVGLRRGRRNANNLDAGDTLDFWRVLYANKTEKRLLLFAEMKMPGEAWLEFKVENGILTQTASYRPLGLSGRLYWYSVLPFHYFIFNGMIDSLVKAEN